MPKLLSLTRSHLLIFVFISITLVYRPYVLFMSFMVSCLTFKSYATLILFLCTVWRNVLSSLIFTYGYPAFPIPLADKTAFLHYVFLLPLLKILSIHPEKMKALIQKKNNNKTTYMHVSVHNSTTHNCQDMGSNLSVHSQMNKEDLVCVHVYCIYICTHTHTHIQQNVT